MKPDGAFYGFLHVDGLNDSLPSRRTWCAAHKVGVAPGSAFSLGDPRDEFLCAHLLRAGRELRTGLAGCALQPRSAKA